MNIQLLSDLHLEVHPHFVPQQAKGADLLVLAGDIGSYQTGSLLATHGDTDFGLARFSPLHGWPTPVLFVPGNHEYDGLDFDATHARLREACERLGITWLEQEVLAIGSVRFIGSTLWTDFDALAPAPAADGTQSMTLLLQRREKAFRAANFYLRKAQGTRHGQPLLAEQVRELGLAAQEWLRAKLAEPFDGKTVVVTHFAPSLQSADPRYPLNAGTAGFCNALDDLVEQAGLWLHGHLHAPSDYLHKAATAHPERNACRVVANPLGYARKNEQAAFRAQMLVSV